MFARYARKIIVLAAFFALPAHAADELIEKRFPLPQHGAFKVSVPESWIDQIRQPPNLLQPTIRFDCDFGNESI
jgi:hypothetical protein